MCPHNKACNCIVGGFLATTIMWCDLYPHECPYQKKKESHLPEKSVPYMHMVRDGAVFASGSQAFQNSALGNLIGKMDDDTKLYYVKPQYIEDIGGKFTLVIGDKKISIDFEIPPPVSS